MRNTWVTYPEVWNNSSKELLIPHVVPGFRKPGLKSPFGETLREGPAVHQLVGRVMAYQGDDG